jgi:hypothetical protein
MSWKEQELASRKPLNVDAAREKLLNDVKKEAHPIIIKESDAGGKTVVPVKFQPVQSPGIFEAEFGVKDGDLIYHFWPWGLHVADKSGRGRPAFKVGFGKALAEVMKDSYKNKAVIEEDRDMGAWFVKVVDGGKNQFHRKLAINTVTALHKKLGGKD